MFRTPASWTRAGGDSAGAFIVDWDAIDLGLLDLKTIIAEDIDHGRKVEAELKRLRRRLLRRLPSIRVPAMPFR